MKRLLSLVLLLFSVLPGVAQNKDPLRTEIVTTDIANFWTAFDAASPDFSAGIFQKSYLDKGSPGIKGFTKGRIESAGYLSKIVKRHAEYYASIRESTLRIEGMKDPIRQSLVKLKELYPEAIFPPVYFVIGALNSGGTTSRSGLIIGAEMYGLTANTPMTELNDWLKTVIKPVDEIPHVVAHELVHFQQRYDGGTLLAGSIREGAADFIAELISGKHINGHVHEFANPREKELWLEFKERMHKKDFSGWLYSDAGDRPHDLGYWMGYQITKSYYDHAADKKQAIADIMDIRDFDKFLKDSRYEERFAER